MKSPHYNDAPVLFFSYEQSAAELRIKSLARLTKVLRQHFEDKEALAKKLAGWVCFTFAK